MSHGFPPWSTVAVRIVIAACRFLLAVARRRSYGLSQRYDWPVQLSMIYQQFWTGLYHKSVKVFLLSL